jgi:hypothetical protein
MTVFVRAFECDKVGFVFDSTKYSILANYNYLHHFPPNTIQTGAVGIHE